MSRAARDAYYTPAGVARRCCVWLLEAGCVPRTIVEPSVGGGAFVGAARGTWPGATITRVDLDPDAYGLRSDWRDGDTAIVGDWARCSDDDRYDLVVGNPPYLCAEPHIVAAVRRGRWVALLLRETITGGCARYHSLWRHLPPAAVLKLPDRPQWTGDNPHATGDTAGTVLVVWDRDHRGATRWDWLPLDDGEQVGLFP